MHINGDYNSFIFDLNIIKNLYKSKEDHTLRGISHRHIISLMPHNMSTEFYKNPKDGLREG